DGVFTENEQEVTYVYLRNPGVVIIPNPLIPATPSNIVMPGDRNTDITIRPNGATPSIATRSNGSRGGSGSGNSSNTSIKSDKLVLIDSGVKNKTPEAVETENQNPEPTTNNSKATTVGTGTKRDKLPVPKTEDRDETYMYLLMLTLSLMAFVRVKNKKE
ncbi:hypothetical protein C7439_1564, partial [Lachnoanaerobaculum umeaense]